MKRPFTACDEIILNNKRFLYLNDDNPYRAYLDSSLSFVAQPSKGQKINKENNIVSVPLLMSDEWDIINEDNNLIHELRQTKKEYDYLFIGQCHYMGREKFKTINLNNYYFRENRAGIFHLNKKDKKKELIKFLKEIAKSRFIFCPRGIGSSSFRLYQTMMVGSVPIETGMNDYPFSDEVEWSKFCISGDLDNLEELIDSSKNVDYEEYSRNAKSFWDNYCRHNKLVEKLEERYG
jgi:hypothetical protein